MTVNERHEISGSIQDNIGYLHISAISTPAFNLSAGTGIPAEGLAVTTTNTKGALAVRWVFESDTGYIYTKGSDGTRFYLHAHLLSPHTTFISRTIDTSKHYNWSVIGPSIYSRTNPGCGICLEERSDKRVGVACCNPSLSTMRWAWHAQP